VVISVLRNASRPGGSQFEIATKYQKVQPYFTLKGTVGQHKHIDKQKSQKQCQKYNLATASSQIIVYSHLPHKRRFTERQPTKSCTSARRPFIFSNANPKINIYNCTSLLSSRTSSPGLKAGIPM
jgi:hypothetical protein